MTGASSWVKLGGLVDAGVCCCECSSGMEWRGERAAYVTCRGVCTVCV